MSRAKARLIGGGVRSSTPWWLPVLVSGLLAALYLAWAYAAAHGQPEAIFHVGDPRRGTGYDGQFVYFMARDLNPQRVQAHLDVPPYRYQRILLPLLAHLPAGNVPARLPVRGCEPQHVVVHPHVGQ